MRINPLNGVGLMYPCTQTAIDNATSLLAIIYAGIDALPPESRLADGIALALDHLAEELDRARTALG